MKPSVKFRVTLNITAANEHQFTQHCVAHLRDKGYSVHPPRENTETVAQFCARHGIISQTVKRALARPDCPNVTVVYGSSGRRITGIISNDHFDAFVRRNKTT